MDIGFNDTNEFWPDAQRDVFGHQRVLPRILVAFARLARNLNQPCVREGAYLDGSDRVVEHMR